MRSSKKSQPVLSPWVFGLFVLVVFAAGGALVLLDDSGDVSGVNAPVVDLEEQPDRRPVDDIAAAPLSGGDRERITTTIRPTTSGPDVAAAIDPDQPTGEVTGIVVDPRDRPVAGVVIRVYEGSPLTNLQLARKLLPPQAVSDGAGRFVLAGVPIGKNYVVVGEHDDFARSELPGLSVRENQPPVDIRLVMQQGSTISGMVTTLGDNPISQATIELYDTVADSQLKPADRLPWKVVFSDPSGRFAFEHVSTPSTQVRVSAPGFESQNKMLTSALQASPKDQHLVFKLDEGVALAGQCINADTGKPVGGVRIEANALVREFQGHAVAFSVDDGSFLLDGLSREYNYNVRAEAEGFSVATQPSVSVTDGHLLLELRPRSGIEGWVVDAAGKPVTSFDIVLMRARPGAQPSLMGDKRHFTNAQGHFVFDNLEPGHYAFEARAEGFAASQSEPVELVRGASTPPSVTITMRRGGTLKGVVVDGKGEPVVRALVEVNQNNFVDSPIIHIFNQLAPSPELYYRVRTNAKGRFQIQNVPAGTYQISVKHQDHAQYIENDVVVQDDDLGTNAELRLEMPLGATVSGRALDENRQPLAYTQVQIHQTSGFSDSVTTDDNGFWRFENLRPGTYNLQLNPEQLHGKPVAPLMRLVYATRSKREVTVYAGQELTGLELYLTEQ